MDKIIRLFLLLLLMSLAGCMAWYWQSHGAVKRWVVYYDDQLPGTAFRAYDVVVFDAVKHPALEGARRPGNRLLGYISLGEAGAHRPYPVHEAPGVKAADNPSWPGNYVLDLRQKAWQAFVLEVLIPEILAEGFDGLMIDTLDSALALEAEDPERYAGMREAALRLLHEIRLRYPAMPIMVNRAFELLPEMAASADMLLAESVLVDYRLEDGSAQWFSETTYAGRVSQLREAQQAGMDIYTLDYWNPKDTKGVMRVYARQRAEGFSPYVATVDLRQHYPEPGL